MAVIAPPSAALGARLNDTVTAGNCPWWLIESGSSVLSICVNALRGTALDGVEPVVVFVLEAAPFEPTPDLSAFAGAMSAEDDGV